jgi:hypothetical protein
VSSCSVRRWLARGSRLAARCCLHSARLAAPAVLLVMRTRGSLRSGRGGRRGRLAPCRGPLEGARAVGIRAAVGDFRGTAERLAAHPARTDARWASVPGARRPRLPPLALRCREGKDPEGSCAAAPSRAWLQRRRLRSPAHCVGTRRRRLRCRAWGRRAGGLGAEDAVTRRFARGRHGGAAAQRMRRRGASRAGGFCARARVPHAINAASSGGWSGIGRRRNRSGP